MSSYSFLLIITVVLKLFYVSCIDVEKIIENASPYNVHGIEERNPSGFRLTKLLDIQLNGKSNVFDGNLDKIIGSESTNAAQDNNFIIDGKYDNQNLEQFRKEMNKKLLDVLNAVQTVNTEVSKIKQLSSITKDVSEKENTGLKTLVGVQYKRSSVRNLISDSKKSFPKNCKEIFDKGYNVSGIYQIQPKTSIRPFPVLCDMDIKGGGWTDIQKRYDGSQDFYLEWRDYKFGFGDLEGEFWIGLENIYKIMEQEGQQLLIELEDRDGTRSYAQYSSFKMGSEKEGYPLSALSGFTGDAGDALTPHLGSKFSTKDFDQDENPGNCAVLFSGAWWYKSCHTSNLNGKYINLDLPAAYKFQGLHWKGIRVHEYSYAKSRMLIKPS